jgi:hypothetical protein
MVKIPGLGTVASVPFVGPLTVGSVALGTAAGFLAGAALARFGRPVVVSAARAGYRVKDAAVSTWEQAKAAADDVRREASAPRTGSRATDAALQAEVQDLRQQIATLRGQLAKSA